MCPQTLPTCKVSRISVDILEQPMSGGLVSPETIRKSVSQSVKNETRLPPTHIGPWFAKKLKILEVPSWTLTV